jgi:hypothetical protein
MRRLNIAGFLSGLGLPAGLRPLNDSQPQADHRRLGTVPYAKFVKDAGDVHRDCPFTDEQGARDLAVTVPPGEKDKHLGLPAGEVKPCRARGSAC